MVGARSPLEHPVFRLVAKERARLEGEWAAEDDPITGYELSAALIALVELQVQVLDEALTKLTKGPPVDSRERSEIVEGAETWIERGRDAVDRYGDNADRVRPKDPEVEVAARKRAAERVEAFLEANGKLINAELGSVRVTTQSASEEERAVSEKTVNEPENGSDPVCPKCGSPAAGNRYCPVCGLALSQQGGLPTRAVWTRERDARGDESRSGRQAVRSLVDVGAVVAGVWMVGVIIWIAASSPDTSADTSRNVVIGAGSTVALLWLGVTWLVHQGGRTSRPYSRREAIPQAVKEAVWSRDGGRCVYCGGRDRLEFDHIIPVSKGGSSTERNLQLLCLSCNRRKYTSI